MWFQPKTYLKQVPKKTVNRISQTSLKKSRRNFLKNLFEFSKTYALEIFKRIAGGSLEANSKETTEDILERTAAALLKNSPRNS